MTNIQDSVQASEISEWDPSPFKEHPEKLVESDENSVDVEKFEELNKYKTELHKSDSNEPTDDDEDLEEYLKKLKKKSRPMWKDK